MKARQGITLLEMLVVVTVLMILLSAAGVLLAAALRSSHDATSGLARQRALANLDRQLRRDIRSATDAEVKQNSLTLTRGTEQIVYEPQAAGIQRREGDAETKVTRRELFRLEAPVTVQWKISDGTVTLQFEPPKDREDVSAGWRGIGTTAVVGSDRRFSAKGAP
jgi:type II secretory pathway pseudopilin PulG